MRFKILSVLAAALFLAACDTTPKDSGAANSAGSGNTGAATTAKPSLAEDFQVNVGDRVFFGFDKYDLTPEARATLDRQAAWLGQYQAVTVTVEGHADERGTREYNLALGERRANAVKKYLVARGVATARIKTISYGKERPAVLGSDEAAWAQNRRGVTVIN